MLENNQSEIIKTKILNIRGKQVMLDRVLAELLKMETKRLLERCKRNGDIFNKTDYFQLSNKEFLDWRSQFATSNPNKKGLRRAPFLFTKSGIESLKIIFKKQEKIKILDNILLAFKENAESHQSVFSEANNRLISYVSSDGEVKFDVQFDGDTIWLNQQQMAELFNKNIKTINEHINNIFEEKELVEFSVIRNFQITAKDGKQYKTNHYNLDVIISVGYRVKSKRGTQFRQWATKFIKRHLINGFTVKDRATNEQLQQAQTVIHNQINVSDVHVHIKNGDISIDLNKSKMDKFTPLFNQLIEDVKDTQLEMYLKDIKKNKRWTALFEQFKKGSYLRDSINLISNAKDTFVELLQLFN